VFCLGSMKKGGESLVFVFKLQGMSAKRLRMSAKGSGAKITFLRED